MADDAAVDPAPGAGPLSTTTTLRPDRASSSATLAPITPAPMTTASAVWFTVVTLTHPASLAGRLTVMDTTSTFVADSGRYDQMTYRRSGRSGVDLPMVSL